MPHFKERVMQFLMSGCFRKQRSKIKNPLLRLIFDFPMERCQALFFKPSIINTKRSQNKGSSGQAPRYCRNSLRSYILAAELRGINLCFVFARTAYKEYFARRSSLAKI
ncbi:MAG: hypothetical protein AAB858_03255, partial [Patescibacteria group bacterium]